MIAPHRGGEREERADDDLASREEHDVVRPLLRIFGWLAAVPYVLVVVLVMTGPPTWSAVAYLAGGGLLVAGLVTVPKDRATARFVFGKRRPNGMTRGALVSIAVVMLVRVASARSGETLHFAPSARLVDRLVDEQDIAVAGTRVLVAIDVLARDDKAELPSAMRAAYARMRAEEGDAPSPVAATYLGMQSASDFDLLLFEPAATSEDAAPSNGVIFLHGFAGNFTLPCWQMARVAAEVSRAVTACPSTRWVGDWWSPEGEAILRRTVDVLHQRGVRHIVLSGLSNGGIGASRLAPRMRGTFAGLMLISGEAPDARSAGIPTLIVHGRHDTMTPFFIAQGYAERAGAKLVVLEAGHFAMLVRASEHDQAVRTFLGGVLGSWSISGRNLRGGALSLVTRDVDLQ